MSWASGQAGEELAIANVIDIFNVERPHHSTEHPSSARESLSVQLDDTKVTILEGRIVEDIVEGGVDVAINQVGLPNLSVQR